MACLRCGGKNDPCCEDGSCDPGLGCNAQNICIDSVGPSPPSPPPSPSDGGGGQATNWLMFIGIGVAVLLLGILVLAFMTKK